MSVKSNSNLGGVGTLLIALTSIVSLFSLIQTLYPATAIAILPFTLPIAAISLAGGIMFLVSLHGLAQYYHYAPIFRNALYAILTAIVGSIIVAVFGGLLVFFELVRLRPQFTSPVTSEVLNQIMQSIWGSLALILVAIGAVVLVSMIIFMRSLNALAQKSGVARFRTAGLLFPVSAAVSAGFLLLAAGLTAWGTLAFTDLWIVTLPGSAVQIAAWILATQAFFRLKAKASSEKTNLAAPSPVVSPMSGQVKYCIYCGAQNNADATYCKNCGKPQ